MSESDYTAEHYLDWPEIAAHYRALVEGAPEWARLDVVGESREGRELLLLTIGDLGTDPDDKPGFWLDAGTHAVEWTGVMSALRTATCWVAGLRDGIVRTMDASPSENLIMPPDEGMRKHDVRGCHSHAREAARSTRRHVYPHSLSYHAKIFARLPPSTHVEGASTIEEWELPTMSAETI